MTKRFFSGHHQPVYGVFQKRFILCRRRAYLLGTDYVNVFLIVEFRLSGSAILLWCNALVAATMSGARLQQQQQQQLSYYFEHAITQTATKNKTTNHALTAKKPQTWKKATLRRIKILNPYRKALSSFKKKKNRFFPNSTFFINRR